MQINSKSRLACQTQIGPELERNGRIVVEPMRNQPVLRDLVVEQESFWRQYDKIEPHLILDPRKPMPGGAGEPDDHRGGRPVQGDARGASRAPPATPRARRSRPTPEFPGPMALAKLYRFVVDPRDQAHQDRLVRIQTEGLWLCLRCHLCTEACPKDVRPSERIRDLKEMAIAAQGATETGRRHAVGFKDNIRERGLIHESKLVRQTSGLLGLAGQATQGMRMIRKKPEILKSPARIEGLDEVEKIYEALDDAPEGKS